MEIIIILYGNNEVFVFTNYVLTKSQTNSSVSKINIIAHKLVQFLLHYLLLVQQKFTVLWKTSDKSVEIKFIRRLYVNTYGILFTKYIYLKICLNELCYLQKVKFNLNKTHHYYSQI